VIIICGGIFSKKEGSMKYRLMVLLVALTGAAAALPSWWGTRGLNRVVDARTVGAGKFNIGLFTHLGISGDERTAVINNTQTEITNTEYDGTGYIVTGFGLGRSFELGISVNYLVNQMKRASESAEISGDWEGDDGFSEATASLKWNFNPSSNSVWFGIMPWVSFAIHDGGYSSCVVNGDGWDGIWVADECMYELRRPMINAGSLSYGANLLTTFNLNPAALHVNLGYHKFNQSFEYTDLRYDINHQVTATEAVDMEVEDAVLYAGGGIEYPIGQTTLFVEAEWRHFLDRNFDNGDGEDYDDMIQIAPGIRFNNDGLAIDVTGSFALSDFSPDWSDMGHGLYQAGGSPTVEDRANRAPFPRGYFPQMGVGIGLSYTGTFRNPPAEIGGRIYDSETGEALSGTVSASRDGVDPVNTAQNGTYAMEAPKGRITLTGSAEGYLPVSETVDLASGGTYQVDFPLSRIETSGVVSGTVTDVATGLPLDALVSSGSIRAETGPDGTYSIELPSGNRNLTASASAYGSESAVVAVPAGGTAVHDFQLGLVVDFDKVYFDLDSSVLRRDAKGALDEIAAFLLANPGVSVTITGNTCDLGAEDYNQALAERRAEAVRSYLISKGVSQSRLQTVSYGESRPAAPNTDEEHRALNRRAEFVILGR